MANAGEHRPSNVQTVQLPDWPFFSQFQKIKERWYEKLHDWEQALEAYNKNLLQKPEDLNLSLGRMRCLEALGEW